MHQKVGTLLQAITAGNTGYIVDTQLSNKTLTLEMSTSSYLLSSSLLSQYLQGSSYVSKGLGSSSWERFLEGQP